MRYKVCFYTMICFCVTLQSSCKKLVAVDAPSNELTSSNIYSDNATAASVLTGIYAVLSNGNPQDGKGINSLSLVCGLSADELTLFGGAGNINTLLAQFYLYKLTSGSPTSLGPNIWSNIYSNIYIINTAIDGLSAAGSLTPGVKQQLIGEAKFMRAFFYFYLVNLYGNVPLITTTNYETNATISQSRSMQVYQQVVADLKDAKNLLTTGYVSSDAISMTLERTRPNRWAATALLARAYLYTGDLKNAELEADSIINHSSLYSLNSLNNVFLKNSTETIWQLQPVIAGWNTPDGEVFILPPSGPTNTYTLTGHPVYLSDQLLSSFEPGDARRMNWVDSVIIDSATYYFPYKYKSATLNAPVTEYSMVLRLSEQYLIRAEARAARGNIIGTAGALADLNIIRHRAGLSDYSGGMDQTSVSTAIIHERQVELFTEWGHRWLDLKRTGLANSVMGTAAAAKGANWSPNWQLYPVPLYDIIQDPNLKQNLGY